MYTYKEWSVMVSNKFYCSVAKPNKTQGKIW